MTEDTERKADEYYLSGQSIEDIGKLAEQTAQVIAENNEDISLPEARKEVWKEINMEVM